VRGERLQAADVVGVVVGGEDRGELEVVRLEEGLDGGAVAGIDDGGARSLGDHPEIVVLEGGNGVDLAYPRV
jgi:hypothetical protein